MRPLCDDESDEPSAITRDYTPSPPPATASRRCSVFGGKLTTYRKLAESALAQLQPFFFTNLGPAWTAGNRCRAASRCRASRLTEQLANRYAWLDRELALRWRAPTAPGCGACWTGSMAKLISASTWAAALYAREVDYLCKHEWAQDAEDIPLAPQQARPVPLAEPAGAPRPVPAERASASPAHAA